MKNNQFVNIKEVIINKNTIANIKKSEIVGPSIMYIIKVQLIDGAWLSINFKCNKFERDKEFKKVCSRLGV